MNYTTRHIHDRNVEYTDRVFYVPEGMAKIEHAAPSEIIPLHYHPEKLYLRVVTGGVTLVVDGKAQHLHAGDQGVIPAERFHSVYFGENGCSYMLLRPREINRRMKKEGKTYV